MSLIEKLIDDAGGIDAVVAQNTPRETEKAQPLPTGTYAVDPYLDRLGVEDPEVRDRVRRLSLVESGNGQNLLGETIQRGMHKGDRARGVLQIMPKTFQEVIPGGNVDDMDQANEAGIRYFLNNYKRYGDLDLATVAHHAGHGGVEKYVNGELDTSDGRMKTLDYLEKVRGGRVKAPQAQRREADLPDANRMLNPDYVAPRQEGSIFADVGLAIGEGAVAGVKGLVDLGVATTESTTLDKLSGALGDVSQSLRSKMSTAMQEAAEKKWFEGDQEAFADPRSYLYAVTNMVGSIIPTIPIGGLATKGISAAAGVASRTAIKEAATTAMKVAGEEALAAGATKEAALKAGLLAFETTASPLLKRAALAETVGYSASGTAMTAGDAANGAMDEIRGMSHDELMKSPVYAARYKIMAEANPNASPEEVAEKTKFQIAAQAGREAGALASATALPLNVVGGRIMAKILHGNASGASAFKGETRLGNIGRAAAGEVPVQSGEEGLTQYASNVGVRDNANPDKDVSAGVADAAFVGGLGANAIATGAGLRKPAPPAPASTTSPSAELPPGSTPPAVPPATPLAEAAALPNSPLARAALSAQANPAFAGNEVTDATAMIEERDGLRQRIATLQDQIGRTRENDPQRNAMTARMGELQDQAQMLNSRIATTLAFAGQKQEATAPDPAPSAPQQAPQSPFNDATLDQQYADVGEFMRNKLPVLHQMNPDVANQALHVWRSVINNPALPLATRAKALNEGWSLLAQMPNAIPQRPEAAQGFTTFDQTGAPQLESKDDPAIDSTAKRIPGDLSHALEDQRGRITQDAYVPEDEVPPVDNALRVSPEAVAQDAYIPEEELQDVPSGNRADIEALFGQSAVSWDDADEQEAAAAPVSEAAPEQAAPPEVAPEPVAEQPAAPEEAAPAVEPQGEANESINEADGTETRPEGLASGLRESESQGISRKGDFDPWTWDELADKDAPIIPLDELFDQIFGAYEEDRAWKADIAVVNDYLAERDARLGLSIPGLEKAGLPDGLVITSNSLGAPHETDVFEVYLDGYEPVRIERVNLGYRETLVAMPPVAVGLTDSDIQVFTVAGGNRVFDFIDAVEQAFVRVLENAEKKAEIAAAASATETAPTDAEKETGDYPKGEFELAGQTLVIETPKDTVRRNKAGEPEWEVTMPVHYGYFAGTKARDGDEIDAFVGSVPLHDTFYVVTQNKVDSQEYDEPKVMIGFETPEQAKAAYLASFADGFGERVFGAISGAVRIADLGMALKELEGDTPFGAEEPIPDGDGVVAEEPKAPEGGAKAPRKPRTPRGEKPQPKARPDDYVSLPAAKKWFAANATNDEKNAIGANPQWKVLDGIPHVFNEGYETVLHIKKSDQVYSEEGFYSPRAEKQATGNTTTEETSDPIQQMLDATDQIGLASAIFGEGNIPAEPDHLPMILPGNLIRINIEEAERKEVENKLKGLGFKISDRIVTAQEDTPEAAQAGRMTLSAIYKPTISVHDAGEQMAGGRKEPPGVKPNLEDPVQDQADFIIDALSKGGLVDPLRGGKEQTFGTMMFLEALMIARTKSPLEFILDSSKFRNIRRYTKGERKQVAEIIRQGMLEDLTERAELYRDLMLELQRVADEAGENITAVYDAYVTAVNRSESTLNTKGYSLFYGLYGTEGLNNLLNALYEKFGKDEHSTDQTVREVKQDPKIPPRLENIIRRGLPDWRKGRNVSVQGELVQQADGSWIETGDGEFTKTFGLRGIEFGNWVNQEERQVNVNMAYDALMDMAHLLGVPTKAIGRLVEGGTYGALGMAIGARGRGGRAAAHYEPGNHVFNLTKTKGNGTVSHEWTHALEQAVRGFGTVGRKWSEQLRKVLQHKMDITMLEQVMRSKLASENASQTDRNVPPRQAAFNLLFNPEAQIYQISKQTNFFQSARDMDSASSGEPYWATGHELIARAFEAMFFDAANGGSPYLTSPTVADSYMTPKNGYTGTPYPVGKERAELIEHIRHSLAQIDFENGTVKSYEIEPIIKKMADGSYMVFDQMGVPLERYSTYNAESEAQAKKIAEYNRGQVAVFGAERKRSADLAAKADELAKRIDAIMEEMGIIQFPEVKNGSMAESMFYHLRNGWWPKDNVALKKFAAQAFRVEEKTLDLLKLKQAQEDFEAALGKFTAQRITDWRKEGNSDEAIYRRLVEMYQAQPNLNVKTSTSMSNQAYSTPIPIGFIAGLLARVKSTTKVLEPTAGNGLLAITANPKNVIAVELEEHRAHNLKLMDYNVKQGNALTAIENGLVQKQEPDVLITNPPFGVADEEIRLDGYKVKAIDQQIAGKMLAALPDDGRAVLILGANLKPGLISEKDRVFLNWLYGHYNVSDHFEIPGEMYSRQGAGWPIRVIVIAGRNRSNKISPASGEIERVTDWNDLWRRSNEALQHSEQIVVGSGEFAEPDGRPDQDAGGISGRTGSEDSGAGDGSVTGGTDVSGADQQLPGGQPGDADAAGDGRTGVDGGTDQGGQSGAGRGSGGRGNGEGRGGKPSGIDTGGLSGLGGLTGEGIDALVAGALNARNKAGAGSRSGARTRTGGRTGASAGAGAAPATAKIGGANVSAEFANIAAILGNKKFSKSSYTRDSGVDESLYTKLLPEFAGIWNKVVAKIKDAAKAVVEFTNKLADTFGNGLFPYITTFIKENVLGLRDTSKLKKRRITEDKDNALQQVFVGSGGGDWSGIYVPRSLNRYSRIALDNLENKIADEYPDGYDQWVASELGYPSTEVMFDRLGGYQVATLALAIDQIRGGNGFIVGHDTGVGKGRIAAAMIAWAKKNGKIPVFMTVKNDLYSDIYRDLSDIGFGDMTLKMTNAQDAFIAVKEGDKIKKIAIANKGSAKATIDLLLEKGELNGDALLTTYSQFDGTAGARRRDALRNLVRSGKVMLIMDESHNAAGESARNDFFMELLTGVGLFRDPATGNPITPPSDWNKPPTMYLSATFSKRSANMPVYARTDLIYPADGDPDKLRDIFLNNNQLTQVAAEMLVESGQMLRFERSYEGIDPKWLVDTENQARDARMADKATEIMRALVLADRAFGALVKNEEFMTAVATLLPPGVTPRTNKKGIMELTHSPFTSVVHNLVKQLLLASKVNLTVENVISALNRGEKPIIALESTMEATLDHYAEMNGLKTGDSLKNYSWVSVFNRQIENSKSISFQLPTGDPYKMIVPDQFLLTHAPQVFVEFERVKALASKASIDLPVSPIDAIRHAFTRYGVYQDSTGREFIVPWSEIPNGVPARQLNVTEVTGRDRVVDYTDPANPRLMNRKDDNPVTAVSKFNDGRNDVAILNVSGSTGISLHASENFEDQRARHMYIAQSLADIAVFKQMLGRINRTGQVELPLYTVLSTGIPAEKRLLAVLRKKFKSLMSGTTGAEEAATDIDVTDFINEIGDYAVADYLRENPLVQDFVEMSPGASDDDVTEDFALKVTGRIALLSVEEQVRFYEAVEQNFQQRIAALDAIGENPLNRPFLPYDAVPEEMDVFVEGDDDALPFKRDAMMNKMEVNVVGESPSPTRVREAVASSLGIAVEDVGTSTARAKARIIVDNIESELRLAFEEAQNQLVLKLTDLENEIRSGNLTAQQLEQKEAQQRTVQTEQQNMLARKTQTLHQLRQSYPIGTGMKLNLSGDEVFAIVTGYRTPDPAKVWGKNPYQPSNFAVSFTAAIPNGALSFALSQLENKAELVVNGSTTSYPDIDEEFVTRSVGGRKKVYIATGNLPLAIATLRDQGQHGKIIQFSQVGESMPVTGLEMPSTYKPGDLAAADFTVRSEEAARDYLLAVAHGVIMGGDEYYRDAATEIDALLGNAPRLEPEQAKAAIRNSRTLLFSRGRVVRLEVSPYNGRIELTIKLPEGRKWFKEKQLTAQVGDFAARRGDTSASRIVPANKLGEVIRVLRYGTGLASVRENAEAIRPFIAYHAEAKKLSKKSAFAENSTDTDVVRGIVNEVTGKWKDTGITVEVYGTAEEARQATGDDSIPDDAEGWYEDGEIGLIAANLHGAGHVRQVLAHEAVGHYGMEAILGADFSPMLKRVSAMEKANQVIREIGKIVDERQPGLSQRRRAAEIIAIMAERGVQNSIVSRVRAAIRNFLRNVLGIDLEMNDADLAAMIRKASQRLEDGTTPPGGGNKFSRNTYRDDASAQFSRQEADEVKPWAYSQLAAAISQAPERIFGTAKQFKAWLAANAGKLGVKKEEVEWSGINDWLDLNANLRISKDAVLTALSQDMVRVQEVVLGEAPKELSLPDEWYFQDAKDDGYDGKIGLYNERNELITVADTEDGALEDARDLVLEELGYDQRTNRAEGGTKYSQYTLPGGENYRELLLTLPEVDGDLAQRVDSTKRRIEATKEIIEEFRAEGNAERVESFTQKLAQFEDRLAELGSKMSGQKISSNFQSSHFDTPNILAHIRFNERTDADGKKVLFIEEIQSDWAQKGKKDGFKQKNPLPAAQKDDIELTRFESGISDSPYWESRDKRTGELITRHSGRMDESAAMKEAIQYGHYSYEERSRIGIPHAPFVTDTKAWVGLAIKRMIRYAAESGFDKVAFINGEQSADRYDLSKHISSIELRGEIDNAILRAYDVNGQVAIEDRPIKNVSQLEDLIGKDPAKRLLDAEPKPGVGGKIKYREISGDGLKVGGEGMKAFYDQIVPQVARDVLKKLGGTVETTNISLGRKSDSPDESLEFRANHPEIYGEDGARSARDQMGNVMSEQLGFTITPELRRRSLAGVPLFSRDSAAKIDYAEYHEIPAEQPINLPIDGDRLKALRRAAASLERPQDGIFLRVTEDGEAVATGQKGQRIPDAFRRFANENGLTFKAERQLPVPLNHTSAGITPKSEPMPIAYRESGAMYFGESGGGVVDRTSNARFSRNSAMAANPFEMLTAREGRDKIIERISSLTKQAGTFNWWHKTVGTQFHKAKIDKDFGRVYELAQQYIDDISKYATEAADKAPGLLPKLERISDAIRGFTHWKQDGADAKAIADAIYAGTLDDEKVYSDEELADRFNLNERQIDLYHQFRAAVDRSMDDLAKSEMIRMAKSLNLDQADPEMSLEETASYYTEQLSGMIEQAEDAVNLTAQVHAEQLAALEAMPDLDKYNAIRDSLKAKQAEDAKVVKDALAEALAMRDGFARRLASVSKMKAEGYAPLMRFGKYTLDVVEVDENGDEVRYPESVGGELGGQPIRHFFGMFESKSEATEAARIMREEYPNAKITEGIASEESHTLFGGINPGTIEMLAKIVGEEDEVMQRYLKMATASRSAMKRLIHRKKVAGHSDDVVRSLASFIVSNARAASSNVNFADMLKAATEIPKEKGDVKDEAVKLINYIRNPEEEAAGLRGILFMQYIGGSIASAIMNLTQTMTTTFPYLHQFGGTVADLVTAGKMAGGKVMTGKFDIPQNAELRRAIVLAQEEGVIDPRNIHALMGDSVRHGLMQNRFMRNFMHLWGSAFSLAEQFNREVAFIAAFNLAKRNGKNEAEAYKFAKNAVSETQFVFSKAARPNWSRGALGATLMTFKQFSVFYIELMKRLPVKERAIMLTTLVVLAGLSGIPGADDLDDLIDTLGQFFGYDTNSKRWKAELTRKTIGKTGSEFMLDGVTAFLPYDIGKRLGLGNLIPGSAVFKKSETDRSRDALEFFGAAGGQVKSLMDAYNYVLYGQFGKALTSAVAPKAIKDLAKGREMLETGIYTDTHGRKVADTSVAEGLGKMIGLQPTSVSRIQEAKGILMQDINLAKAVSSSLSELWAQGIFERNPEKTERARQMLKEWNAKNPETPIRVKMGSVQQRVKQMQLTAAERMANTAPKLLRGRAKEAFE